MRGPATWSRRGASPSGCATSAPGVTSSLHIGRRREPVALVELEGDQKIPVLRAYLRRWKVEIGAFFQGVGPDAPDADLARIAPGYPAFRVERRGPV